MIAMSEYLILACLYILRSMIFSYHLNKVDLFFISCIELKLTNTIAIMKIIIISNNLFRNESSIFHDEFIKIVHCMQLICLLPVPFFVFIEISINFNKTLLCVFTLCTT